MIRCETCHYWLTLTGSEYAHTGFCRLSAFDIYRLRPDGSHEKRTQHNQTRRGEGCDLGLTTPEQENER